MMRALPFLIFLHAAFLLVPSLVAQGSEKLADARRRGASLPGSGRSADAPLSPREYAQQMLNRFTYGARPGEVERVMATGPERWFDQQLNPGSIANAVLDRRLNDFPTLKLQPDQALNLFPDRGMVQQVAEGKRPYPTDPQLAAMYEVQVFKYNLELDRDKIKTGAEAVSAQPGEADPESQKKAGQAIAGRIAGNLFSLPKNQRMAALLELPVSERIAFTSYVGGDQKSLLLSEFSPRERELFQGMAANVGVSNQIVAELSQAKILRDILSERQVEEMMTDFWFNHFNVYIGKDSDQWYTTTYERDAIRKHALGKFRDLLLATATSPAMMVYLDNWQSIGPNSIANGVNPANPNAKRGNRGLNENYGREVMELHTLSVNGGYSQADVTALSAILTGWGVDRPSQGGPFLFDPKRHEPGAKVWLGHSIAEGHHSDGSPAGMQEGVEALTLLAASPKTAHFISYLLAQRFLADDPPQALVDRLSAAYQTSDGDIRVLLRVLVASPEFRSRRYFRAKVKTPVEFLASAFRTTSTDPVNPGALVGAVRNMGMPLYYALPPTGYVLTADRWMNTGALVDRLNFAYQLTAGKFANQKFDSARTLALTLLAQPTDGPLTAGNDASANAPAVLSTAGSRPVNKQPGLELQGSDLALHFLAESLIGGDLSLRSRDLIGKQVAAIPQTSGLDTLNLQTALILGSPEFQMR